MVAESADVRPRVRELVEEAARRLGVEINSTKLERSAPLPAALDEFLAMIGPTRSDLSEAWFPSGGVGRDLYISILFRGRRW